MFDKFGEFDSVEELNRAAEAQAAEGDREALLLLAEENGIGREDAEDLLDGAVEELANTTMAAHGKLKVEEAALGLTGVWKDWVDLAREEAVENEEVARGIRKRGKRLEEYLSRILAAGFRKKEKVPDAICEAANLQTNIYLGTPSRAEARKILRKYYGGAE